MMTRTTMHPLKVLAAVGAAFLLWGLLFAYASSPAQAADITVNSLADDADGADGECTLREAITSANNNTASGTATGECAAGSSGTTDVVNIGTSAVPVTGTVNLTGALPNLSTNIDLEGPGANQFTVRRNTGGDYSIFTITGDTTEVSISGMTISNGDGVICGGGISIPGNGTLAISNSIISGNSAGFDGGGICNAGSESTVTVTDSTIAGNSALFGGGIRNDGTLTVRGSTISGNSATISGNSANVQGGGIANFGGGTVTVSGSTISDNSAGGSNGGSGGGIANSRGTLTVTGSTISGNTAAGGSSSGSDGGKGGGIYNGASSTGNLTVTDSTISENSATAGQPVAGEPAGWGGEGGGIYNDSELAVCGDPASAITTTTITNSTISGNTAAAGKDATGGGIFNYDGPTVIKHSTITNNTAPDETGSGVASYGDDCTPIKVFSSIISANSLTDVDFVFDTTNSFTSNGYNLIGDGNATAAFNQSGDQVIGNDTPGLIPLADNGGPTHTHALQEDSLAIDAIPQDTNGCGTDITQDQRGVQRPQGEACDIGAYEGEVDLTAPFVSATIPQAGQEGVSPATNVKATFSEAMKKRTINSTTFTLKLKGLNN